MRSSGHRRLHGRQDVAALELQHLDLLLEGLHLLCLVVHQPSEPMTLAGVKVLASVWGSLEGRRGGITCVGSE